MLLLQAWGPILARYYIPKKQHPNAGLCMPMLKKLLEKANFDIGPGIVETLLELAECCCCCCRGSWTAPRQHRQPPPKAWGCLDRPTRHQLSPLQPTPLILQDLSARTPLVEWVPTHSVQAQYLEGGVPMGPTHSAPLQPPAHSLQRLRREGASVGATPSA